MGIGNFIILFYSCKYFYAKNEKIYVCNVVHNYLMLQKLLRIE
jgi:hypothetical protein